MRQQGYWRDIALEPKLWFIDAYACFPLLLCILHLRAWTITLAFFFTLIFTLLARFKFTIPIFKRVVKNFFAGRLKIARPWWRK